MEKVCIIASIELAKSHGLREGETFAVCYVREDVKNDDDVLAGLGVFDNPSLPYIINISTFAGNTNEEKLKDATTKLVGKTSKFNVLEISVTELTNGEHRGYTIDLDGETVEVTKRTLIGKSSDSDLIEREKAALYRRVDDKDNPIKWL